MWSSSWATCFHIKGPARNSHRLVQRAHDVLTAAGIPVVLSVGNHDLMNDRLESLDSQPLGALGRMEGVEVLIGQHESLPIFAIPYLQDWQTLPGWVEQYKAARKGDDSPWMLLMHAPIFPKGITPPYDYISAPTMCKMVGDVRTVIAYGHIHDPHGVHGIKGPDVKVECVNYGAISRGSLHIETMKRKPQAYIYDSVKDDYEVLDIPHRPVEEIFPIEQITAEKAQAAGMTSFLDGVGSGAVDATNVDAVVAAAKEAQLGQEVESVVLSLLTSDE